MEEKVAKRFNTDKIDFTLVPVDALEEEAKVWMMGEKKYGRSNWATLWGDKTVEVVMQSALRHCNAILKGERVDDESGLQHAAHVRCNMAMLVRYFREQELIPTPPTGIGIGVVRCTYTKDSLNVSQVPNPNPQDVYEGCVFEDNEKYIFNKTQDRFEERLKEYNYNED